MKGIENCTKLSDFLNYSLLSILQIRSLGFIGAFIERCLRHGVAITALVKTMEELSARQLAAAAQRQTFLTQYQLFETQQAEVRAQREAKFDRIMDVLEKMHIQGTDDRRSEKKLIGRDSMIRNSSPLLSTPPQPLRSEGGSHQQMMTYGEGENPQADGLVSNASKPLRVEVPVYGLDDPCDVEVKPIDSETSSQHLGVKYSPKSKNLIKSELTVDASCEEVLKSDLVVDEYPKEDHASLEVNTIVDTSDVVDSVQTQVTFNHLPSELSLDFVWNKSEVVEAVDGYKLVVPACVQSISSNFCRQGVCEKVQEISLLHFEMFGELNEGYDIVHGAGEFLVIWQHKPPPLPPENVLKNEMLRPLLRRFLGGKLYSLAVLGDFIPESKKLLKTCDEVSPMGLFDSQSIVFYKPSNNSYLSFSEEDHSSVLQISGDLSLIFVSKIEAGGRSTTYGLVPTWPDGITKGRIKEDLKQFEELCEVKYRFGDYVNKVVIFDRVVGSAYYLDIGECGCTANMDDIVKAHPLRDSNMDGYLSRKKPMKVNPTILALEELRKSGGADINVKSVKNLVVQTMCWPFVMVDARFLRPPAKPPDGMRHLEAVVTRLAEHSFVAKASQCDIGKASIQYWDQFGSDYPMYRLEDEVETEGGQVDTDEVGAGHVRGGWMQSVHGFQVDDVMCDITMCWRVEEVSYIV
ncbi:hypothetical protein QQ045_029113 [Rhodiola kirilowii]